MEFFVFKSCAFTSEVGKVLTKNSSNQNLNIYLAVYMNSTFTEIIESLWERDWKYQEIKIGNIK